jgi:cell fate (sporulation/competence/biofilm development) regulator YlbF (YheA/YmcA/DUF963 family)
MFKVIQKLQGYSRKFENFKDIQGHSKTSRIFKDIQELQSRIFSKQSKGVGRTHSLPAFNPRRSADISGRIVRY